MIRSLNILDYKPDRIDNDGINAKESHQDHC